MKTLHLSIAVLTIGTISCARFRTAQTDVSTTTAEGIETREITTKASATTFFSAKSSLAQFKASQTDKTQGATVGSLVQEGGQTNQLSDIIRAVSEGAVAGAVKATIK